MTTLKQRREGDKRRVQEWRKRQINKGKKGLSIMISLEAYQVLKDLKEKTGESNAAVVERALLALATIEKE